MASATDLGGYYQIPPDGRDLNYAKYVEQGKRVSSTTEEFHSHNAKQLDVPAMQQLLLKLDFIQRILRGESLRLGD